MSKTRIYLRAFQTIAGIEIQRIVRIWIQTLIPPVITMTLYFLIFGHFIGERVGQISGVDYIEFMAPGLIMMNIITNSYMNVVSSFYSKRFQKSVEEFLVAPVPDFVILTGFVAGGVFRAVLVGTLVSLVALMFTDIRISNPFLMIPVVFLSALLFSFMGFINSLFARNFDDISIIPAFILTPLTYLGGIFYSISLLPEFWAKLSLFNPMLYMINAFRFTMLGVSDVDVQTSILLLCVFNLLIGSAAYFFLRKGIGIRD